MRFSAIGALVGRDEVVEAGLPLLDHVGGFRALGWGQYARLCEPGVNEHSQQGISDPKEQLRDPRLAEIRPRRK